MTHMHIPTLPTPKRIPDPAGCCGSKDPRRLHFVGCVHGKGEAGTYYPADSR